MVLVKYDRQPHSLRNGLGVSIHEYGAVTIGFMLYKMLGQPRHVELWFDPDEQKVGITAVPQPTPMSLRVGRTRIVSCKGFLRTCQIDHEVTRKYSASFNEGMVLVDLRSVSARTFHGIDKKRPQALPNVEPFTIVPRAS